MEADRLTTTQKVVKEHKVGNSMAIWHFRHTGKVKRVGK